MEKVKQERFAILLLKGLTIDEASELTSLIKEERLEWHEQEVKKLIIPDVIVPKGTLPFNFVKWYSGMDDIKIMNAYNRWLKEKGNAL